MKRDIGKLRENVELACQPQNAGRIEAGRKAVQEMEREFVLLNIESIARQCLDLNDYWEYRRFLELCEVLDMDLVKKMALIGVDSLDPDVREASDDFR